MTAADLTDELDTAIAALHAQFNHTLTAGSILRLLPKHLRPAYEARLKEHGPEPEPPLVVEDPRAGVRGVPAVTDNDIARAVLQAKAVVELDERGWRDRQRIAALEVQNTHLAGRLDSANTRERELRQRLQAVRSLHFEAEQVVCGDGCCHEGLGYCRFCGPDVPYPCRTYQVADGATPSDDSNGDDEPEERE